MTRRFLNPTALLQLGLLFIFTAAPVRAQGFMAAAADDGRLYWASSNATGAFSGWTQLADFGSSYTRGIAIGNFDNDYYPDIVSGRNTGNEVTFFRFSGKPNGGFEPGKRIGSFTGTGSYLMDMASGDFNGDNVEDFAANSNSNVVAFFLSDGNGGFTSRTETIEHSYGRGMDAGDFNGDGRLDLVRARCCDGSLSLYLGDGTGSFTFARTIGSAVGDPYGLASADFNGDGNLDVLTNEGGNGDLRLFRGNGDGTFAAFVRPVGADLNNHGSYDAYDYNGDGLADLVAVNYSGQRAFFIPGLGDGNFGPAVEIVPAASPGNLLSVAAMPYAHPRAPIAVINPDHVELAVGATAHFDGSGSSAPAGSIISREWNFGDGLAGSSAVVDHTYTVKGRYWVVHRLKSDNGLSGIAKSLATVTGAPPRAEAGGPYVWGESQSLNGTWTGELDGSGTQDDGGEGAKYVWNLMPDLTFSEDFSAPLDPAKWQSGFANVQNGSLRVGATSGGDWGAAYLASQANFNRRAGMTFQTRFQSHAGEAVMFGFKNTLASQYYTQLQYAFYFYHTTLYIYENGSNRGNFRTVPYNTWHDFKIEIKETGADYWYRAGGTETWERVYQSTYMGTPEMKVGISGYYQGNNEFDDIYVGRREEGRRIVTSFGGPAAYPVTLTVTDFQGQASIDSSVVTTAAGAAPVASTGGPYLFGEGAALNGQWVARLNGTGSTDDVGIAAYLWDFGDGATGTGPQPTHTYAGRGPYTIRLTVTDNAGLTHSDQGVVGFQLANPPVASFTSPAVADESLARNGVWTVPLDAGASTDDFGVWRYQWAFGNGGTGTGRTVNGIYSAMGVYQPAVTVFDHAGQSHSTTRTLNVIGNALPVARISAPDRVDEDSATDQRWRVAFGSGTSTDDFGIWRHEWTFGDGNTSTLASPVHQYASAGSYNATLRVFDHAGQSHAVNHSVTVAVNLPPVARILASPTTAEGRRSISFDARTSTDDFGISRYDWDFGMRAFPFDGTAIDPMQWAAPAQVIQNGRIIATGTNSWGPRFFHSVPEYQRRSEMTVRVRTPASGPATHAMVGFKNAGTGTSYEQFVHALYFNNGTLGVYENGSSLGSFGPYLANTEYEARIVTRIAGADYFVRKVGDADFRLLHSSTVRTEALLKPGATVYSGTWEFDDLSVRVLVSGEEAVAGFAATTDAILTVTDHGGQTHSATQRITIVQGNPPVAAINAPAVFGLGLEVQASGLLSTDDFGIALYEWDFGDGTPRVNGDRVGHFYASAGVYTIRLTVYDYAGQTSSASQAINITGTGLVRAVPWRFNGGVEIPHDTWTGKEITLKAVANTARTPLTYTWDFGDGSPTVTGTAANEEAAYKIEAKHAYSGSNGTPFIATIAIVDADGTRATDTYPVVIKEKSLTIETNVAIDEALWYLHKNQTRTLSGTDRLGSWASYGSMKTNSTASAVQAFEINGHAPLGDPAQDPYVETVRRGLDFLFTMIEYANIGPQAFGNPDGNNNGIGITGTENDQPYQMGSVMDAIISSGAPDGLARTGGTNVRGRRYRDIVQDMADMYAWGQEDAGWAQGGWRYSWHGGSDNSAAQWGAIGLIPAEKLWGIRIPAFVKEQNRIWTNNSYLNSSPNCGFGYTGPGHSNELTPSGLVQLAFQRDLGSASQWDCAERRMDKEWTAFINANTTYGYYAFTKAMRLAHPAPVVNLKETGRDWFDAEPNGLRRTLVTRQRPDGSWLSSHPYPSEPLINSAWTTIILTPTLFENPPVAIIHASPNPGAIGQSIRFDASQSYHLDPFRRVVSYDWDFDASDGINWSNPDASGPVANRSFGSLRSYTVSLRVGDDQDPARYDVTTIRIDITIPPHPPTSVPGGPYVASVGELVALDGSGSFDIDRTQGDSITRYGWEIDFENPRDFDDALGARPAGVRFTTAGTFNVGLRVTDNTAKAFPTSGQPDLSHDAFTTVQVQNRCLDNLQARVKETMVALTWAHDGSASYSVLRSTVSPSFGFQEIGRTSSTFSTFVDYNVEINRTYYYRVQSAKECGSYAVSAVPRFRSTNRRPIITSQALTTGQEGQAYAYDVNAVDPDGTALTYFLDQAPAGMSIVSGTGLIGWIPTQAQAGQHAVAVRVSDGVMSAVQAYILTVAPRSNLPPAVTVAGASAGIAGQNLSFSGSASDPEGDTPITYAWNFGDGGTGAGSGTNHVFGAAGTFVVTLFATDSRGATGTATHTVVIEDPNRAPIVRAGGPYTVPAMDTLTFDGSASSDPDGDAFTALWNFGDDSDPVAGTVARHVYRTEGTFQASLELRDGQGGIATATVPVIVTSENHAPVARLVASGNFSNPGEEMRFDATSSSDEDGDALVYTWDFGDGSGTGGDIVTHVYTVPGRYTVALTADDQRGRKGAAIGLVHVNAPPIFQAQGPLETPEDEIFLRTVEANDADGDALTYSLAQGPSGLTLDPGTGRLFWIPGNASVGDHTVRLRAEDGRGGAGERSFQLRVSNVNDAPVITSTAATAAVELQAYAYAVTAGDVDVGDQVTFALALSPAGMSIDALTGIVTWFPGHADVGQHPIVVLAVDGSGASDEQRFVVSVSEQPWAPEFTSSPPVSAAEDAPFQYQATARDMNAADVLAFSLSEAPSGMAIDPVSGLVTWTPDNSHVGVRAVRIRVTDGTLSTEQTFSLAVSNTNDAPSISSAAITVAVVGEAYAYDVQATDPDIGDVLAYSLIQSSGNAVINGSTGVISWTPTETEVGEQAFLVRVTDAAGLSADQAFTASVQRIPEPPVFTSAAVTAGTQGIPYSYQATASDPNGDALTFALVSGPAGMTVTSDGLVTFTPGPAQVGSHAVRLSVTDSRFTVEQPYALAVANVNDNPIITSVPPLSGTDGVVYTYPVVASDFDGDALTYALNANPAGMSISPTGVITWPDDGSRPLSTDVEVEVRDGHGGTARQSWSIGMVPDNVGPTVSIMLTANPVAPGQFVTLSVETSDNVGVASMTLSIDGVTVPLSGNHYQFQAGTAGDVHLLATATDLNGNTTQSETVLHVSASVDAVAPQVSLSFGPPNPKVGDLVTFNVGTTDAGGVDPERTWLLVDGQYIPVTGGHAEFRVPMQGSFSAHATAYDLSGNFGQALVSFSASIAGSDAVAPTAVITAPDEHAEALLRLDIIGTATDANFAYYTLSLREEGASEWVEFHRSSDPVTAGRLGIFDATQIENGEYQVRLLVFDKFGNQASDAVFIEAAGNAKLGEFTLGFTDMHVKLTGIDLEILRNYDSRVKVKRDFGIGWSLDIRNAVKVIEKQDPNLGWKFKCSRFLLGGCIQWETEEGYEHQVTVDIPGFPKQEFILDAVSTYAQPSGLAQGEIRARAKPGTYTRLEPIGGHTFELLLGGELLDFDFEPVDPNIYRLTMVDGTSYIIDQEAGTVTQIADANGNTVQISAGAITHSDGHQYNITRDSQGRVILISDGGGAEVRYTYDGHGNLATFRDVLGNVTRFKYDPGHRLTEVIDPRGVRAVRTEYDADGRLVRRINPDGKVMEFEHDPDASARAVTDFEGNRTVMTYDPKGNVTSKVDARGNAWAYAYDSRGNLLETVNPDGSRSSATYNDKGDRLTSTDELGRTTTWTFNALGRPLTERDPLGRVTTRTWNAQGNETTETGPDGTVLKTWTYDGNGRILSVRDALGRTTNYVNQEGRVLASTDALGRVVRKTYDSRGNSASETDARGNVTLYANDKAGNLLSVTDAEGGITRYTYTSFNRPATKQDARGNLTRFEYDAAGMLLRDVNPDGGVLSREYDGNGRVNRTVDPSGRSTRMVFDDEGRLLETEYADGTRKTNEYDALGHLAASVDERGNRTAYSHDAAGQLISIRDPLGNLTRYEYDAAGNQTAVIDPLGRRTRYEYDEYDQQVRTIHPDGSTSSVEFDDIGQKVAETDPAGRTSRFEYDAVGNLIRVTDAAGGVTEYGYDASNNRISIVDANGNRTTHEYDALNRLTAKIFPGGARETYQYDATGSMTVKTAATGETIISAYDSMRRETQRTYSADGRTVRTEYSQDGLRTAVTDSRGRTAYGYDVRGRLASVTHPDGAYLTHAYDAAGNKAETRAGRGATEWSRTAYVHDAVNRLVQLDQGGKTTVYEYDGAGNRILTRHSNGVESRHAYDPLNRLLDLRHESAGGSVLSSFTYTLDAAGTRTKVAEADGSETRFAYDGLNRLTGETRTGRDAYARTYAYDAVGNRIGKNDGSGPVTYEYNVRNQLIRQGASGGDILSAYDAAGRIVSRVGGGSMEAFLWAGTDRMESAVINGATIRYEYDSDGRKVADSGSTGQVRYLIDETLPYDQVVAEYDQAGGVIATYAYGLERISQSRGADFRIYLPDGQGSARQLADAAGSITDTYDFTAYGELLASTGTTTNIFLYAGEQEDRNTSQYYLRARWMDPGLGRFTSPDPFEGCPSCPVSLHPYQYADLNPVNMSDPTGMFTLGSISISISIQGNLNSTNTGIQVKRGQQIIKMLTCGAGTAYFVRAVKGLHGHHGFMKAMGGRANQPLIFLPPEAHHAFHWILDLVLKEQGLGHGSMTQAQWNAAMNNPVTKKAVKQLYLRVAALIDKACKFKGPLSLVAFTKKEMKAIGF